MESITKYLDPHWMFVFGIGMLVHLTNICIVGFCGDDVVLIMFQPDLGSVLFTISLFAVLGKYKFYPESLRKPHYFIETVFDVLTSLVIANAALFVIWIPILTSFKKLFMEINNVIAQLVALAGMDDSVDLKMLDFWDTESSTLVLSIALGLISFAAMMYLMKGWTKLKEAGTRIRTSWMQSSKSRSRSRSRINTCSSNDSLDSMDQMENEDLSCLQNHTRSSHDLPLESSQQESGNRTDNTNSYNSSSIDQK